jgi:hypothetical protein
VADSKHLPNINRISVLSAAILLAFTVAGFTSLPTQDLSIQIPSLFLNLTINTELVIAFLIAGLTASGADWLVREHPSFQGGVSIQHWLLPALTAWVIGLILFQQPFSFLWWIIFAIGGATLVLVLIAEFIVVDPNDIYHIPATIGLTALAFALFLTLTITIRNIEARVFLLVPTITVASGLTSLRTLHLLQKKWAFTHTTVIAIIIGQLSAALNFIRIDPITFGLILLGPAYALTSLAGGLLANRFQRRIILEPLIVLCMVWGIALLIL